MYHFYVHIPGDIYALSCWANSEREARASVRRAMVYTRLPRGTAVWRANPFN